MNGGRSTWLRWEIALIVGSVAVSVVFAVAMVIIASQRSLSPLEAVLLQILALGVGLVGGLFGSYKFGQRSAADRQYARSALRSVLALFRGIQRLYEAVALLNAEKPDPRLEQLQLHIQSQLDIADAAINDWRDVIQGEARTETPTREDAGLGRGNREYEGSI